MKMTVKSCLVAGLSAGAILPSAAPGQAAGTDIYQAIASREFGTASKEMAAAEKEITNARPDQYPPIEARLIAVLEAPGATMPGKRFACQMLRIVGSARCVPAVGKLLTDPQLSYVARQVFLGLADPAVEESLRKALGQTEGNLRIGIINTIGDCGDSSSLKALAVLLSGNDEATAAAALNAIGKSGGTEAADVLEGVRVADPLKAAWAQALLRCTPSVAAAGQPDRAEKMYRALVEGDAPMPVRSRALGALAQMRKEQAVPLILKTLSSGEALLRRAAVSAVISVPGNASTRAFAKELPGLPPETKVVLLGALASRGDAEGLTEVVNQLAADGNEAIRGAALKALARLGKASSVPVLAGALRQEETSVAATQAPIERQGAGVAEVLIGQADTAETLIRPALLSVLAQRRQSEALPALRKALKDDDAKVRRAALKSLAVVGTAEDFATLAEMVLTKKEAGERDSVAQAMSELGARLPDKSARCAPVLQAISRADAPTKVCLLTVLSALGGDQALQAVRDALAGEGEVRKTAVRALAGWPDAVPMTDLLRVAREDKEQSIRILALRGFIRMANQPGTRTEQKLEAYRVALQRHEETLPYALWLKTQLDYPEVADQFRLIIKPPKPPPDQPPLPPNPTPQQERASWIQKLAQRPWPDNAKTYVARLKPLFTAQKVPPELVWIAEVEYSFDPRARSPAGAAGLFQLMPATAKRFGLRCWPLDQRLTPEKNAGATAKYLQYLHGHFNDWRLALAAFNAGEAAVDRLLQERKAATFDAIAPQLPAETQMYVPRIEATLLRREGVRLSQL
jgi:HEAT repeat protein